MRTLAVSNWSTNTAFGKLVSGIGVVDAIIETPRDGRDKPNIRQSIFKASVIVTD